ncbi:Fructokinase-1 [Drechslerella dactyloides]|uniref:Fructokinase-1 n=1 Tax=Drechslerella dactyloides TaxID=74499 RepID=A0AAD6J0B8_DREDA|nr:Fructokinase-1 [Drechslerella dactyloides]
MASAESFATYFGGKGANQAVACARLSRLKTDNGIITAPSAFVRMAGCVGDDDFGTPLKNSLQADGVDVGSVETKHGVATGVAVILVTQPLKHCLSRPRIQRLLEVWLHMLMHNGGITQVEPSGENRILITAGANGLCEPSAALLTPAPALLVMQLEIPRNTVLEMLKLAAESSPPIATLLNPAPASQLPESAYQRITHLIVNETEAAILGGGGAALRIDVETEMMEDCRRLTQEFVNRGVRGSIVITLGAKGAFWHDVKAGKDGLVPSEKVQVVDTTAAGDTFIGAFAVKVVNGNPISIAVAYAVHASAKTVTKQGAQSSIPWRDEVDTPTS